MRRVCSIGPSRRGQPRLDGGAPGGLRHERDRRERHRREWQWRNRAPAVPPQQVRAVREVQTGAGGRSRPAARWARAESPRAAGCRARWRGGHRWQGRQRWSRWREHRRKRRRCGRQGGGGTAGSGGGASGRGGGTAGSGGGTAGAAGTVGGTAGGTAGEQVDRPAAGRVGAEQRSRRTSRSMNRACSRRSPASACPPPGPGATPTRLTRTISGPPRPAPA